MNIFAIEDVLRQNYQFSIQNHFTLCPIQNEDAKSQEYLNDLLDSIKNLPITTIQTTDEKCHYYDSVLFNNFMNSVGIPISRNNNIPSLLLSNQYRIQNDKKSNFISSPKSVFSSVSGVYSTVNLDTQSVEGPNQSIEPSTSQQPYGYDPYAQPPPPSSAPQPAVNSLANDMESLKNARPKWCVYPLQLYPSLSMASKNYELTVSNNGMEPIEFRVYDCFDSSYKVDPKERFIIEYISILRNSPTLLFTEGHHRV